MKKFIIYLLLAILIIPISVKADMGMPELFAELVISNPDGAYIYDYDENGYKKTDEKLDYGKEVIGMYEEEDIVIVSYDDRESYVKKADLKPKNEKVDLNKYDNYNKKFITLNDVKIYNGPFKVYGETGVTIPKGTTITIKKNVDGFWGYVNEGEYKGFVAYSAPISYDFAYAEKMKIATYTNVKIYEEMDLKSDVVGEIPAGEILVPNYNFINYGPVPPFSYVEYNGKKGWVLEDIATEDDFKIKITDPSKVKVRNFKNYTKAEKVTFKKGQILESKISYMENHGMYLFLIEVDNNKYWLCTDEMEEMDETSGFDFERTEDSDWKVDEDEESKTTNKVETEEETKTENKEIKKKTSIKEYVIYGVIGGVVVALTGVVTLILINKKKKNKTEIKNISTNENINVEPNNSINTNIESNENIDTNNK